VHAEPPAEPRASSVLFDTTAEDCLERVLDLGALNPSLNPHSPHAADHLGSSTRVWAGRCEHTCKICRELLRGKRTFGHETGCHLKTRCLTDWLLSCEQRCSGGVCHGRLPPGAIKPLLGGARNRGGRPTGTGRSSAAAAC
jgi:hypothetical protein